jgi:hypothetical protein
MPLKSSNDASNAQSKGATTNTNPSPTPMINAGAPAEQIAGKAPHEGGSDQNSTINVDAAKGEAPNNRARPDAELDGTEDKSKRPEAKDRKDTFDPTASPGFHVMDGKRHLGTYGTEEDAQAFIDGHLAPQKIKGKVVQGSTSSHDSATEGLGG